MNIAPMSAAPRRAAAALALASALVVAACSAAATPPGSASPGAAAPGSGAPAARPSQTLPPLSTVPPTPTPVVGEAPAAIVAAARADLATRISPDAAASASVVRAEAVQWPDGSLGCRVPGEMYPQVVTPGYWIVLSVDGTEYDYRATEAGAVRLCEQALRPSPGG